MGVAFTTIVSGIKSVAAVSVVQVGEENKWRDPQSGTKWPKVGSHVTTVPQVRGVETS